MANCCLIFSVFIVTFVAIVVGLYHNQVMPEGMPDDQQMSLRVCGVGLNILRFLVRMLPAVNIPRNTVKQNLHSYNSMIG